jgi:hypothetical protein
MRLRPIEPEQRTAAKVVGVLYLLLMVTGLFGIFTGVYARGQLIVPGDAVQTASNLAASERLFRVGAVSNLITFAGDVALVLALYVVLQPINRNLALLAAFWRLAESAILAVTTFNEFAAVQLLSGAAYLRAFDTQQLLGLARSAANVEAHGYLAGVVFLGLGSTVFSYLWLESRYIPRGLAGWGIFSSLLVVIANLAILVFPDLAAVAIPLNFAPLAIFEVATGLWLLIRGLRPTGSASLRTAE